MKISKRKKEGKGLMVAHGEVTHPALKWEDCLFCIRSEIEMLEEYLDWGGKSKFVKHLEEIIK